MKVLMLSTDRNIFLDASAVRSRMVEYGDLAEELHIIVFTLGSLGFSKIKIAPTTWVYPTGSLTRWFYMRDAVALAGTILPKPATRVREKRASHANLHALRELYEGKSETEAGAPVPLEAHAGKWLVTVQDPFETGRAGVKIKRTFAVPLHVQVHTDFLSPHFAKRSFLNTLRVSLARDVLPHADGIRVVSERVKRSLIESRIPIKTNPAVLPIYVPREDFEPELARVRGREVRGSYPNVSFLVLMLGRIAPEKNHPLALAAFKRVLESDARAGLLIVGDGPEKAKLEKLVASEGLGENVFFLPWSESTRGYYGAADAFLLSSDYEGYSLALIEAALSETPIVTTDVGIASDLFEDGKSAFLCHEGDAECLAKGVLALAGDPGLRDRFRSAARAVVDASLHDKAAYLSRYRDLWERCFVG